VDLAIERQQDLPALVYEARPTRGPYRRGMWARGGEGQGQGQGQGRGGPVAEGTAGGAGADAGVARLAQPVVVEMQRLEEQRQEQRRQLHSERLRRLQQAAAAAGAAPLAEATEPGGRDAGGAAAAGGRAMARGLEVAMGPPAAPAPASPDTPKSNCSATPLMTVPGQAGPAQAQSHPLQRAGSPDSSGSLAAPPQRSTAAAGPPPPLGPPAGGPPLTSPSQRSSEDGDVELPDAIKLGLGDFIFYSMLVGRAAMYDMMTVFSSYLAIMAGLGLTLLLLAVTKRALPALPFSIALGVAFYFLTRLALEPFLVPLVARNLYF
jgi:presenilin 1